MSYLNSLAQAPGVKREEKNNHDTSAVMEEREAADARQ